MMEPFYNKSTAVPGWERYDVVTIKPYLQSRHNDYVIETLIVTV